MRIVSNMSLPERWERNGLSGTATKVSTWEEYVREGGDLWMVNCDPHLVFRLVVHQLLRPWKRCPMVALDLVLRKPEGIVSRLKTLIMRLLFKRVDLFIHYFKQLDGYERYFGIGPSRSDYIPFKPNLGRFLEQRVPEREDGEYVLCFGKSMRDYDTFLAAMATLPYPGAILGPDMGFLKVNESRLSKPIEQWPTNVLSIPFDFSDGAIARALQGAKLVALPILKETICASGIGTYLNSMLFGKAVILSRGPGGPDVLKDEAVFVEPEDAEALAAAIRQLWEDDKLRDGYALRGQKYSQGLGGVPELCDRALDRALAWYQRQGDAKITKAKSRVL